MRPGTKFAWLVLVTSIVGICNYVSRKVADHSYAVLLPYNRIYAVKEQLRILRIVRFGKDRLQIIFDGEGINQHNHFQVFDEAKRLIADQWGRVLTMKPSFSDASEYLIRVNEADSFHINIEFPQGKGLPEISETSLLLEPGKLPSWKDWVWDDFPESPADKEEASRYLRDSMKINSADPSATKVVKISSYILRITAGRYGTPSDSMIGLGPIGQLNCVRAGRSKLYCGNFGNIFAYFSNKAGVPARYVECGSVIDGIVHSEHVFNEVYLKETSGWAYVDLTDGNVFVVKDGRMLNALEVQRQLQVGDPDVGFNAIHYQGDSLLDIPFRKASYFGRTCLNANNTFIFYYQTYKKLTTRTGFFGRLTNFLYTGPYYAVYSDNIVWANYAYYLRIGSSWLFILGLTVCLLWLGLYGLKYLFKGISGWSQASVSAGSRTSIE